MNRGKILLADNDPVTAQEISLQILTLGLETLWVPNGHDVIRNFIHHTPLAAILRDNLPEMNTWEVASLIRAIGDTPIIFLANHPDRLSRNRALQLGDDYMSPPWQWERLPRRLAVLLRRSTNQTVQLPDLYDDGFLTVDISGNIVTREGKSVTLSHTEFKLLSCFVRHPNRALTYGNLLQSVWGHSYLKAKSDVSQYVRYLRQKIEADPARPAYIRSIRGIGYLFDSRL